MNIAPLTRCFNMNDHLTNHWPISDGSMSDIKGSADMLQGPGPSRWYRSYETMLVADRCDRLNSALDLNNGYTSLAEGVYFNSAFTISAWVYPHAVDSWSRLVDIGNGWKSDNILLAISKEDTLKPCLQISDNKFKIIGEWKFDLESDQALYRDRWSFLAATFDGTTATIYINGDITGIQTREHFVPNNVVRSYCYIGKSNNPLDGYSYSRIDDLRFYNVSLCARQIKELMQISCYPTTTTTVPTTSPITATVDTTYILKSNPATTVTIYPAK